MKIVVCEYPKDCQECLFFGYTKIKLGGYFDMGCTLTNRRKDKIAVLDDDCPLIKKDEYE